MKPIAIIGMGCFFPKATDTVQYWSNILNRVDAITEVPETHWKAEDYYDPDPRAPDRVYCKSGGFIPAVDFNPMEYGIPPKSIEATSTAQILALMAAKKAVEDAGCKIEDLRKDKTGVILGAAGYQELSIPLGGRLSFPEWRKAMKDAGLPEELIERITERAVGSYVEWQETSFPGLLGNVISGRITNFMDLGGTNCIVDAACASSLAALHMACYELSSGKNDLMLSGGVDTSNGYFAYMCFSKTPAMSPTGKTRPFDHKADGIILGEGIGIVALKRLEDAERDGDRIYAVIRSIGSSSDGKGAAIFAPRKEGQVRALEEAYRSGGISPRTIELVEAHGTGTKLGDLIEFASLESVFRPASPDMAWCALGSVKSQIGHTKAAAGSAALIKTALALHYKVLPPTINVEKPFDEVEGSPFYISTEKRPWMPSDKHPRRASVSAFGFGGTNFHFILEEYGREKKEIDWSDEIQIVALSAESTSGIREKLAGLGGTWGEICAKARASRASFNPKQEFRLVMVLERDEDYRKKVGKAEKMLEGSRRSLSDPEGIYLGSGPSSKLAILFPGQGSQYPGMLRDIACRFPQMHGVLEGAESSFRKESGHSLVDCIYPRPAFDEAGRASREDVLRDTRTAQPALGAVSLGALNVLEYFGVRADAYAGHSYGEIPALCAAGVIGLEDLHSISAERGRLMAGSERGSMLAVQTDMAAAERLLRESAIKLVIANVNAPAQIVLSGPEEEIEKAAGRFSKENIRSTKLKVSAAFHSPLVSDAQAPLAELLGRVEFSRAEVPVYSNTTGDAYPEDKEQMRTILGGQLARPVQFVKEISKMHASGIRAFLEVGPKSTLTSLVRSILADKECEALSLDSSQGKKGMHDLARVLAHLGALGHGVDFSLWSPKSGESAGPKAKITVPITGAVYRDPKSRKTFEPMRPVAMGISSESMQRIDQVQRNIEALARMHEQTAKLHQQFLENQKAALNAYQAIAGNQLHREMKPAAADIIPELPKDLPAAEKINPGPAAAQGQPGRYSKEDIGKFIISIIAEKTGYPPEMLELDMNMDSDLGIDSIKKVEIFSTMKEKMPAADKIDIAEIEKLKTLRDVVDFISNFDETKISATPAEALNEPKAITATPEQKKAKRKTTRIELGLEKAESQEKIVVGKECEFWITDDGSDFAKGIHRSLAARGYRTAVVSVGEEPEVPESLGALVICAPEKTDDSFIKNSFRLVKRAGSALRKNRGAFITVTRMDGAFGMENMDGDPLCGGLAGLSKCASHEWPEVNCKAVDVEPGFAAADAIADEIFIRGPVETGLSQKGRFGIKLNPREIKGEGRYPLMEGDVILVTGGARGVTAECAIELARKKPTLVLIGRSEAPEPVPDWLKSLDEETAIKKEIVQRSEKKLKLEEVRKEYQRLVVNREIVTNIQRMESAGAKVVYRSADVCNEEAVAKVVQEFKPVRGLIHGAGVLADRKIEDKTEEEFARVYDTKIIGLRNILKALEGGDLKVMVMFSSISARFGRRGQIDYSVSNEILNKYAQQQARVRPGCKVVSFNWGPWDGGGMVSPSTRKLFESEGIGLIPVREGAEILMDEVSSPGRNVEIVILADHFSSAQAMLDRNSSAGSGAAEAELETAFEGSFNTTEYPILNSHVVMGMAVVPMALIAELLAHGAMSRSRELKFSGINGLSVPQVIRFAKGESVAFRVLAGRHLNEGGQVAVPVELRISGSEGETTSAKARIILSSREPEGAEATLESEFPPYKSQRDLYKNFLFHGPDLRGIERIEGFSDKGLVAVSKTAPDPSAWIKSPFNSAWAADPLAFDVCFQLAAVWSRENEGAFSIPSAITRYRQFRSFPKGNVRAVIRASRKDNIILTDIELLDENGSLIARFDGYESLFYPMLKENILNQIAA